MEPLRLTFTQLLSKSGISAQVTPFWEPAAEKWPNLTEVSSNTSKFHSKTQFLKSQIFIKNLRYDEDPKNEGGMVASLHKYEKYQAALKDAYGH